MNSVNEQCCIKLIFMLLNCSYVKKTFVRDGIVSRCSETEPLCLYSMLNELCNLRVIPLKHFCGSFFGNIHCIIILTKRIQIFLWF